MKNNFKIFAAMTLIFISACQKDVSQIGISSNPTIDEVPLNSVPGSCPCIDEPLVITTDLLDKVGNTVLDIGDIKVWNTNDSIYVCLLTPSRTFSKSQLYIGDCTTAASLKPGQIPNTVMHNPKKGSYTYVFAHSYANCTEVCILGRVDGVNGGGGGVQNILTYTIREICPPCDIEIGDYTTYSKGGYSNNNGNGAGTTAMMNNWNSIGSVTIGCGSLSKTFTTAAQVQAYLPNGKTNPGNNIIAPYTTSQEAGLATQVLALSISLGLDNSLGCLVVNTENSDFTAFNGMSVTDIIELANNVLGGCDNSFTISQMTAIVEALNLNFHEGTVNNGYLTCGDCD